MTEDATTPVREVVEAIYRTESRQILATLIRLLGDFETAEEALHDAFATVVKGTLSLIARGGFDYLEARLAVTQLLNAAVRETAGNE